jgi:hypothetical protein
MTAHTRYAVHLVGTDRYLQQARYLMTSPFQSCKLYSRKQDADKLAARWNKRSADPRYYGTQVKTLPEAKVVSVGVIQRIEVAA